MWFHHAFSLLLATRESEREVWFLLEVVRPEVPNTLSRELAFYVSFLNGKSRGDTSPSLRDILGSCTCSDVRQCRRLLLEACLAQGEAFTALTPRAADRPSCSMGLFLNSDTQITWWVVKTWIARPKSFIRHKVEVEGPERALLIN